MIDAPSATRMDTLWLANYRSLEDLFITLDPKLTVLVAPNGAGKSAILDAMAGMCGWLIDSVNAEEPMERFGRTDVRRILGPERTMESVLPAEVVATGAFVGMPLAWGEEIQAIVPRLHVTREGWDLLKTIGRELRQEVIDYTARKRPDAPVLPLFGYYGTGRFWETRRTPRGQEPENPDTSRFSGYTDSLSPAASFQLFERWFRRFSFEAQSELTAERPSPHRPQERLEAVRSAVAGLLKPTGWERIEWDFTEDALAASHPERGRLPVHLLSDGIRNMIGLVGDIAHRAVRLNPHLGADAASMTPGIVLIDEIDMHLHPGWQQVVIASLREAFPLVQFVVTTHSPHVLSTVHKDSIRILRQQDGRSTLETPTFQTRGVESADVLARIMDVHPVPEVEEARWLSDYRALVQTDQYETDEGRALWDRLVKHFAEEHPVMQELATLRRLQDFKRLHILAGRQGAPRA